MTNGAPNVIGLDLGTTTGLSARLGADVLTTSFRLATPKECGKSVRSVNDPRFRRLRERVAAVIARAPVEIPLTVAWEDVQFVSTAYQYALWVTLRAAVWAAIDDSARIVKRLAVPVGTLKKFATGSGAADKDRMRIAAERRGYLGPNHGLDDNAVDALWVALWALEQR